MCNGFTHVQSLATNTVTDDLIWIKTDYSNKQQTSAHRQNAAQQQLNLYHCLE